MKNSVSESVIDLSLWVGPFPFREIPRNQVVDLKRKMLALNICRGVVAPYDAIFWENNLDAYQRLADELAGDDMLDIWPVVRPHALESLEHLIDRYNPRGLRLVPSYHGYSLRDASISKIMQLARERRLIVQIFTQIADERWQWILKVNPLDQGELDYLTSIYTEQPIVICGMRNPAVLVSRLRQQTGLFVDVSRVRGPLFAMETVVEELPQEKLVFGSLWPHQMIEPTLWQVHEAEISGASRRAILHGNAAELLSIE